MRTSVALWVSVVWVLLATTKPIYDWLQITPQASVDQNLEGSPVERFIFTMVLAIGIMVLAGRREKVLALWRMNGPILLFFTYCLLSVFWSDYPGVAFKRWIKALGDVVMVTIILTDRAQFGAVKRFLACLGFLLVPSSVLLIKYYPNLGRTFSPLDGTDRITGVATDKNMLGAICLLVGLAAVCRVLQLFRDRQPAVDRRRVLIVSGVILAMVAWLLAKANSMTSVACFGLAGGLMVASSFRLLTRKRFLVHVLLASAVAAAAFALFLDAGGGLVTQLGRDPSLTGRTEIWSEVIEIADNSLFGAGFESFWLGPRLDLLWSKHWWHPNEAHNGYIEIFLNLGWLGVCLLAVLIITGYRNVIRALRRDPEAGRLKLAYFTVGVIFSFTEAGFRTMSPVWVCFLLATIAVPRPAIPAVQGKKESLVQASSEEVPPQGLVVSPAPVTHRDIGHPSGMFT